MNSESKNKQEYHQGGVNRSNVVHLKGGKLPPQALDLEEAVLGAAMIDSSGADEMFEVIQDAEIFYKDSHKEIFRALKTLASNGESVDLLTVSEKLKAMGVLDVVGGDYYLIQLTQKISSSAHTEFHCRIILQKYMQRQMIRISSVAIEQAYDDTADVFETMDSIESGYSKIFELISSGKKERSWVDTLDAVVKNVEMMSHAADKIIGVPTGFAKLDDKFGGWRNSFLYILGARPGMGKTAFTVKSMIGAASAGYPVGYVSMEMADVELGARAIAVDSNFHLKQLTHTGFEKPDYFLTLRNAVHRMGDYPIYIDDRPGLSIGEIKRKARQWKRNKGLKLLFVDYLQIAGSDDDKSTRERIDEIARGLKNIAKELDIAVVALSQLTRDVDKRVPPRPKMIDLKESSGIEDAADVVSFLYRPAYYNYEPDPAVLNEDENTEFIIEKYRGGGVGTIGLWWDGNKTKFYDWCPRTPENPDNMLPMDNSVPNKTAGDAFGAPEVATNNDDEYPF